MKVTGNANFSRAVSLASGVASGSKSGKVLNSLDDIGTSTVKSLNHLDDVEDVSKNLDDVADRAKTTPNKTLSSSESEEYAFADYDLVQKAIRNGKKRCLIKNHTPEELKQTIKSVYNGINVLDESVFKKMGTEPIKSEKFNASPFSKRELEIIAAVADGLSNKEIDSKLFLSEGTVKNHISNILEKGEMEHRTQLAIYYLTGKK